MAFVKSKSKKRNIAHLAEWYQKTNCFRKCHFNKEQRKVCKMKFDIIVSKMPNMEMTKKQFISFFNNM